MLIVTTFSVATVVTAYSYASATSNATPCASNLLVEDGGVQQSMAGFIGASLFAMVGLVGLSAAIYDVGGRLILLAATAIVILAVVVLRFEDRRGAPDAAHRAQRALAYGNEKIFLEADRQKLDDVAGWHRERL